MKETSIKLDECGAEVKVDEDGIHLIGKSINFHSSTETKDSVSSDGKGNLHISSTQTPDSQ